MEAGDDEFGELYCDVLEPFSLHNENAEHPRKPEETRSPSSDDVRRAEQAENEVVGTVRLEIYLGSRRVSENTFVFSIGGGGNKIDSELNQSENAASGGGSGGGGRELNSHPGLPETSRSERVEEIAADDAGQELNLESDPSEKIEIEDGDGANFDSEFDWLYGEAAGTREDHGADIILNEASGEDEVDQTDSLVDGLCTGVEPGMGREASEEGELSHNAGMDIAPNSAEAIVVQLPCSQTVASDGGLQAMRRGGEVAMVTTASTHPRYQAGVGVGVGVKPRPIGNSSYVYYPRTSLLELDLDGLEHRPWRHPSVDASRYFNYGLDEAAWKSYCQDFKNLMRWNGRPIQVESQSGLRDRAPSTKLAPRDSTATIQIVAKDKPSTLGSLRGDRESRPATAALRSCEQEKDPKRAKIVQESSGDDDVSDNEWMCRNVGMDNWFHPARRHEADDRRGFRKGRSKLERWTRHDDDDNTSTSSMSPPPTGVPRRDISRFSRSAGPESHPTRFSTSRR